MTTHSPPTRRGRSAGPTGSSTRRLAAVERLADVAWPTAGRGDLALQPHRRARPRPVPPVRPRRARRSRATSARPAAGRGRRRPASAPGMVVVRDGRVVHHELDPALEAKGVRVCGLATCDDDDVARRCSARAPTRRPTRSPCCTTRSSPAARSSRCPPGVVVDEPIVVLHWSEGDGRASFPHTLVVAGESAEVDRARPLRLARDRSPRRRGRRAARRRQRARALPLGAGARPAHLAARAAARARRPRRDRCASSAVALGGDYARLRSESLLARRGRARATCSRSTSATATQMLDFRTLQDHDAPQHAQRPAVQGRGRGHGPLGVLGPRPHPRPTRRRSNAYQTNRNLVLTEGAERGVDPEPRDRGQRRAVLARVARSARSTTTSSTTSRAAASRPRRPSASSCSGSSTTCSTGCRSARSPAALRRVGRREARAPRASAMMGDARAPVRASTTSTPGTRARFDVDGHRLAVVRIGDDFYAIGDACSHADYSLPRATCGRTSARSSARSTARRSRCSTGEPQTLPATQPVPVYEVRVDGDDVML